MRKEGEIRRLMADQGQRTQINIHINNHFVTHASEEIQGLEQFMDNNIFQWQVERMVYLRLEEIRCEMEKIALHEGKESRSPGIFKRIVINTGSGLVGLGRRLQYIYTNADNPY